MDQGHAPGTVLEVFPECPPGLGLLVGPIEAEKRDERGKVVLDPVMDLRKQDLLFGEGLFQPCFVIRKFPFPLGELVDILLEFFVGFSQFFIENDSALHFSLPGHPALVFVR